MNRALCVSLVAAGLTAALAVWVGPALRQSPWMTVWIRDFVGENRVDGLTFDAGAFLPASTPALPDGRGLVLAPGRMLWLNDALVADDVRITADIVWPSAVDGLELHARAEREPISATDMPRGIGSQFGGWLGAATLISPNRRVAAPRAAAAVAITYVPGRRYRLALEAVGDRIALSVDGHEVASHYLALPIIGTATRGVALRAWSEAHLLHLAVERRRPADHLAPTAVGDALLAAGQYETAVDAYVRTASDHPAASAQALERAVIAAETAGLDQGLRLRLLDRLADRHAGTQELAQAQVAAGLRRWQDGQYGSALEFIEAALDRAPALAPAVAANAKPGAPGEQADRLLATIARRLDGPVLDISGLGVSDLEPLRGRRLAILRAAGNHIRDLTPLAGMPLKLLDISGSAVVDISPLRGAPLRSLLAAGNPITDLAPLNGMPLAELTISGTQSRQLAPLAGLRSLRRLRIDDVPGIGLSALAQLDLDELSIMRCGLTSLSLLTGTRITSLDASGNPLANLHGLPLASLRRLTVRGCGLTDLAPVANSGLNSLSISDNRISSLVPLVGVPLQHLLADGNAIADLAPLAVTSDRPGTLQVVSVADNPLADARPLSGHPISHAGLAGTGITDPRPVFNPSLAYLDLSRTPMADPLPLLGMPDGCHAVLGGTRLTAGDIDTLADRLMQRLDADHLRILRLGAALAAGDVQRLRSLAQITAGVPRLALPINGDRAGAQALADSLGGTLATVRGPDDLVPLARALGPHSFGWISDPDEQMRESLSAHQGEPLAAPSSATAYAIFNLAGMAAAVPLPPHSLACPVIEWP